MTSNRTPDETWDYQPGGNLLHYLDDETTDVFKYVGDQNPSDVVEATSKHLNGVETAARRVGELEAALREIADEDVSTAGYPRAVAERLVATACAALSPREETVAPTAVMTAHRVARRSTNDLL